MKIDETTPEQSILLELAQRLSKIRKVQGYSQQELAEEAGIGVATLRRIEAGKDGQLATWLKILKALKMASSADALLPENFKSPMAEVLSASTKKEKPLSEPSTVGIVWGDQRE